MNHNLPLLKDLLTKLYIFKCNTKWLDEIYGTITVEGVKLHIKVESSDNEEFEGFKCLKAEFSLKKGKYIYSYVYSFSIEEHLEGCEVVFWWKNRYNKYEKTVLYTEGEWKVT
jgi:hypothetical protein